MALLSRASCDIASKMVTGRSAKTLFMEVMAKKSWRGSAAGFGRQSRSLPAQYAARQVLVVRQARRLRRQRGGHRALAGPAGQNHLLALRVGNAFWIECRKRNHDATGIGLRGDFIRLADIGEGVACLRPSPLSPAP